MATLSTFFDMVYVYATETSGHGPFTLGSAVTGFQTAAAAGITNGTPVSYKATDGVNWETAHGVVDVSGSTHTLTRGVDTIKSSNSNSLVNFGSGVVVAITELSQDLNGMVSATASQSFTSSQQLQARENIGAHISGLALNVYLGSTQSVTVNTYTLVKFNEIVTDTQSAFNTSTNNYTPNVAGLYLFIGFLNMTAASGGSAVIALYQNGSLMGTVAVRAGGASSPFLQIVQLVQMNGSTDYIEMYGLSSGSTPSFAPGADTSFLTAALLG